MSWRVWLVRDLLGASALAGAIGALGVALLLLVDGAASAGELELERVAQEIVRLSLYGAPLVALLAAAWVGEGWRRAGSLRALELGGIGPSSGACLSAAVAAGLAAVLLVVYAVLGEASEGQRLLVSDRGVAFVFDGAPHQAIWSGAAFRVEPLSVDPPGPPARSLAWLGLLPLVGLGGASGWVLAQRGLRWSLLLIGPIFAAAGLWLGVGAEEARWGRWSALAAVLPALALALVGSGLIRRR